MCNFKGNSHGMPAGRRDTDPSPSGKRERTRMRLVEAATELIGRHGHEALVLETVAEKAGVTRRTIYDHFRNKDDLIVAVIYHERTELFVPVIPGQTLRAYLRTLGKALIDASADNRALGRSTASFHLYALTHDEMRKRIVDGSHKIFAKMEAIMVSAFGREALGMPPRKFVRVLLAVTEGLLARRHLMPEEFSADIVYAALDALAANGK
jgi:AcrR family transcriptional regulator